MYDYKEDVINTRTGNLGSSDAKLIAQCAELNCVPQSAIKRLAIVKGFIENPEFTNRAMQFGDFAENQIFDNLKATDERWESNPCFVSKKYSRKNVGCLTHVDAVLQDDEKKVLTLVEMKATKLSFHQARSEYSMQLFHHYLLGVEKAKELGDYKVVIMLAVYSTEGLNLDEPFEFNPDRLTVKKLRDMERLSRHYNLAKGMDIIDSFLETFDAYYEDEEVDAEYLPSNVKTEFDQITTMLVEIKAREDAVNAFKAKLYDFMSSHNIKAVKNDDWSIVRVDPSVSKSFDSKRFLEDYLKEHPRKAEKLKKEYTKTTKRNGFVTIKLKTNKEN